MAIYYTYAIIAIIGLALFVPMFFTEELDELCEGKV